MRHRPLGASLPASRPTLPSPLHRNNGLKAAQATGQGCKGCVIHLLERKPKKAAKLPAPAPAAAKPAPVVK